MNTVTRSLWGHRGHPFNRYKISKKEPNETHEWKRTNPPRNTSNTEPALQSYKFTDSQNTQKQTNKQQSQDTGKKGNRTQQSGVVKTHKQNCDRRNKKQNSPNKGKKNRKTSNKQYKSIEARPRNKNTRNTKGLIYQQQQKVEISPKNTNTMNNCTALQTITMRTTIKRPPIHLILTEHHAKEYYCK